MNVDIYMSNNIKESVNSVNVYILVKLAILDYSGSNIEMNKLVRLY